MSFVVETGAGLVDANAYSSVASFKSYHDDRGQDYSAYADVDIEHAIVLASDYLDFRFEFIGARLNASQSKEWPRIGACYLDGRQAMNVPAEIFEACCEYALRALVSPLAPDPRPDPSGGRVLSTTKTVGPITSSQTFANAGSLSSMPPYPAVDARLRELINSGRRVLRA